MRECSIRRRGKRGGGGSSAIDKAERRLSRACYPPTRGGPLSRQSRVSIKSRPPSPKRRGRRNMMKRMRMQLVILLLAATAASMSASEALALDKGQLNQDARRALKSLYANNTAARLLGKQAKAVLVFPNIVKAGFFFGGQMGDGVLMKGKNTLGYYNSLAAS